MKTTVSEVNSVIVIDLRDPLRIQADCAPSSTKVFRVFSHRRSNRQ